MPVFQCNKCGCVDNTATSAMGWVLTLNSKDTSEAELSYKKLLGLSDDEKFKQLCSACSVLWFDEKGAYGIGTPTKEQREVHRKSENGDSLGWHGAFPRRFLKKGLYETGRTGNLYHKESGEAVREENYREEEWVDAE